MVDGKAANADAAGSIVETAARSSTPSNSVASELAARALVVATRVAVCVSIDALQLHGGYGYTTEFPIERMVRDAVSLRSRVACGVRSRLAHSAKAVLGPMVTSLPGSCS